MAIVLQKVTCREHSYVNLYLFSSIVHSYYDITIPVTYKGNKFRPLPSAFWHWTKMFFSRAYCHRQRGFCQKLLVLSLNKIGSLAFHTYCAWDVFFSLHSLWNVSPWNCHRLFQWLRSIADLTQTPPSIWERIAVPLSHCLISGKI